MICTERDGLTRLTSYDKTPAERLLDQEGLCLLSGSLLFTFGEFRGPGVSESTEAAPAFPRAAVLGRGRQSRLRLLQIPRCNSVLSPSYLVPVLTATGEQCTAPRGDRQHCGGVQHRPHRRLCDISSDNTGSATRVGPTEPRVSLSPNSLFLEGQLACRRPLLRPGCRADNSFPKEEQHRCLWPRINPRLLRNMSAFCKLGPVSQ